MLQYQRVGKLIGEGPDRPLLLPKDRPLSYLRVAEPSRTMGLVRALLERRGADFRLRIPLVLARGEGEPLAAALERFELSATFPLLEGLRDGGGEVDVCWLEWVQLEAIGEELETGFAKSDAAVAIGDLTLTPTYVPANPGEAVRRSWQYWNSRWRYISPPPTAGELWRVRPNEKRDRPTWFLSRLRRHPKPGFGPQARGTFAACVHPQMRSKLGGADYVVVKHPFHRGWLPVRLLEERFDEKEAEEGGETMWRETIFLDRTARDALGIGDGELCLVYPWLHPRLSVWCRRARDRGVGARTIAAHPRVPARSDLEKPVCRLEPAALDAIGGRAGDIVTIEHVVPADGGAPGERWRRVSLRQRVLPIDDLERAERSGWEAAQPWDDEALSGSRERGSERLRLEGYVDCAERLAVHPPYPAIYLNYNTRLRLERLGLCQPVQIRVGTPSRLMAEASEFAWLVIIALLGAVIAFLSSATVQIAATAALLAATVVLLAFRAIRSIR